MDFSWLFIGEVKVCPRKGCQRDSSRREGYKTYKAPILSHFEGNIDAFMAYITHICLDHPINVLVPRVARPRVSSHNLCNHQLQVSKL